MPVIIDEFELVEAPTAGDEQRELASGDRHAMADPIDGAIRMMRQSAHRAARLRAD